MRYTMTELREMQPTGKAQMHSCSVARGLYYRLSPTERSWYWRGTLQGEDKWISIGPASFRGMTRSFLEDKCQEYREQCRAGIDPAAAPAPAESVPTMDVAWATYMRLKTGIGQTHRDDLDEKYRYAISPTLGQIPVTALTTADIERMFDELHGTPSVSNHVFRQIKPFLVWARRRWPAVHPDLMTGRKALKESPSEIRLSREEIIQFGHALRTTKHLNTANVLFLLMTGCRASVIRLWDPSWVQGHTIKLPAGLAGLKKAEEILITPQVAAIIPHLRRCTLANLRDCCYRICYRAKVTKVSSHDLRRTYISEGVDSGQLTEVMLALTSHRPHGQIARIYVKRDLETLRPAAMAVANHLAGLLTSPIEGGLISVSDPAPASIEYRLVSQRPSLPHSHLPKKSNP